MLNTPENPVYDTLVYMETSLNAYCNIIVDGWEDEGGNLTITSGYAQIQLPRLTNDGDGATFQSTNLVLRLNGNPVESQLLDMPQGEGEGSYELVLSGNTFQMPELQDDYQLELNPALGVSKQGSSSIKMTQRRPSDKSFSSNSPRRKNASIHDCGVLPW